MHLMKLRRCTAEMIAQAAVSLIYAPGTTGCVEKLVEKLDLIQHKHLVESCTALR
jgi:hypothetical protein